ncbi:MAG: hypothetical protein JO027_05425 [Solirubrobacterales bacterium]|nr:hypothetical protein [Solirubrobacterales bacterium]
MQLRSVLDRDLPPLQDAERKLDALGSQTRDLLIAFVLALVGTVLAAVAEPRLAVILAAAAIATLVLAGRSVWRRRELLVMLLPLRDAYGIEAVRKQAKQFVTVARRRRLGGWLREVVAVADGEQHPPSSSVRVINARVLPRRERLLRIADALEEDGRDVHPASVALLHQVLTRPGMSPLYNPGLDEDLLDLALHRVEAGVDPP